MSFKFTDGFILARAFIKSSILTSGNMASFGSISYKVMSLPSGSDGYVGVHPPSWVYLNLFAV